MIIHSLRWQIQILQTVLLSLILGALLVAYYHHKKDIIYRELERDLSSHFPSLLHDSNSLLSHKNSGPLRGPAAESFKPHKSTKPKSQHEKLKARGKPSVERLEKMISNLSSRGNYTIIHYKGELKKTSASAPSQRVSLDRSLPKERSQIEVIKSPPYWEAIFRSPFGMRIAVGTDIAITEEKLTVLKWKLAGLGSGIVLLGFIVGWFITGRSLRTIKTISDTAEDISSGDLSQRIDTSKTHTELDGLAQILNTSFSKLEGTVKQQQRFTADASHEMRTPISVILAEGQLALESQNELSHKQALQTCVKSAQHMHGLINSLLDLARVDTGNFKIYREQDDLAEIAQEAIDLLRPLANKRDLTMTQTLDPCFFRFDIIRMSQVMINLISNAIKYNQDGGSLTVKTAMNEDTVTVCVENTGVAIPENDLPYIFDRFHRQSMARSSSEGSTGLGLAITKAIITAHSGTILAKSEVNGLTSFIISMPIKPTNK